MYDDPQIAIRTVTGRVAHTDIVWEDPVGMMASTHRMKLDAGSTVAHHKPRLSKPLRPGVWKVVLLHSCRRCGLYDINVYGNSCQV